MSRTRLALLVNFCWLVTIVVAGLGLSVFGPGVVGIVIAGVAVHALQRPSAPARPLPRGPAGACTFHARDNPLTCVNRN